MLFDQIILCIQKISNHMKIAMHNIKDQPIVKYCESVIYYHSFTKLNVILNWLAMYRKFVIVIYNPRLEIDKIFFLNIWI